MGELFPQGWKSLRKFVCVGSWQCSKLVIYIKWFIICINYDFGTLIWNIIMEKPGIFFTRFLFFFVTCTPHSFFVSFLSKNPIPPGYLNQSNELKEKNLGNLDKEWERNLGNSDGIKEKKESCRPRCSGRRVLHLWLLEDLFGYVKLRVKMWANNNRLYSSSAHIR